MREGSRIPAKIINWGILRGGHPRASKDSRLADDGKRVFCAKGIASRQKSSTGGFSGGGTRRWPSILGWRIFKNALSLKRGAHFRMIKVSIPGSFWGPF